MKKMNQNILLASICFSALASSGCSSLSHWGFCDKSNLKKPAVLQSFHPDFQLTPLWQKHVVQAATQNQNSLGLAMANSVLYTADHNGHVVALDSSTGNLLWNIRLNDYLETGPVWGNGKLAFTGRSGTVMVVQAQNGQLLWSAPLNGEAMSAVDLNQEYLAVKNVDGTVNIFNSATGAPVWVYHHGDPQFTLSGSSDVVIEGNRAVIGYADGTLLCVDLKAQKILWEIPIAMPRGTSDTAQMVGIVANPVIVGNTVYAVSYQGNLAALDLNTGKPLWSVPFSSYQDFIIQGSNLYIVDTDSHIYAYNRLTGKLLWQQSGLDGREVTAPVYLPGLSAVAVADGQGYIHLLAAKDGHFVARAQVSKNPIVATPMVTDHRLYVLDQAGNLIAAKIA